ncbi:MAG TPA: c-type cytochrome [Thermoanaerobaculia bacterium]|nr:c-type cytochrome [Thermoanaerobaculia bacterium]
MSKRTPDGSRSRAALSTALWVIALAAVAVALAAQQPAEIDRSAAAVGSSLFRSYCASCHGDGAVGDGAVAEYLKIKPADLTHIAARNGGSFPFAQVVKIIDGREQVKGHGHGEMPVWGDAFRIASGGATEEQAQRKIGQLAHYLWSIQK